MTAHTALTPHIPIAYKSAILTRLTYLFAIPDCLNLCLHKDATRGLECFDGIHVWYTAEFVHCGGDTTHIKWHCSKKLKNRTMLFMDRLKRKKTCRRHFKKSIKHHLGIETLFKLRRWLGIISQANGHIVNSRASPWVGLQDLISSSKKLSTTKLSETDTGIICDNFVTMNFVFEIKYYADQQSNLCKFPYISLFVWWFGKSHNHVHCRDMLPLKHQVTYRFLKRRGPNSMNASLLVNVPTALGFVRQIYRSINLSLI